MAKVIPSKYAGTCRDCGGRFPAGTMIEYEKGAGARHAGDCPETPAVQVPTERTAKYRKLSDDTFGITVCDPVDASVLSGERVSFTTSKGKAATEILGELVTKVGQYEAVYLKAALPSEDVVPAGFYAIDVLNPAEGRNDVMFVQVWRKHGRCRVFLQLGPDHQGRELDASDYLQRIIDAGVADAAIRYGELLRRCSRCNAELTNRLSRELNIGPVCGGHFYAEDAWKAIKKDKVAELRAAGLDPFETHSTEMWSRLEQLELEVTS